MSNKIKCLGCQAILESLLVHDFQKCNCENGSFTDGGNDYMRIGGKDLTKIQYWNNDEKKFMNFGEPIEEDKEEQKKEEKPKCSGNCLLHCV